MKITTYKQVEKARKQIAKFFVKEELQKINNRLKTTSIDENDFGSHITHCCVLHGCKYGDEDCPVYLGIVNQQYLCDSCEEAWDEIESAMIDKIIKPKLTTKGE